MVRHKGADFLHHGAVVAFWHGRGPDDPGVKGVIEDPAVRVALGTACTVVSCGSTVRLNVFEEVWAAGVVWSVTVTVKMAAPDVVAGVPVICPFAVLNDSPAGRPGDTA